MSEVYWPEHQDITWCSHARWLAQTFTPLETFDLEWVKLKLATAAWPQTFWVSVQYLKPDGTPTGVDLANSYWPTNQLEVWPEFNSIIFQMFPIRLVKGIDYALICKVVDLMLPDWVHVKYKGLPSDYPRGKLIISYDYGVSWDTADHGDLCFAVWGDPPVKPTPYLPPIDKMAVVDICYTHWDKGLVIALPTNVPCHLTCYYTDTTPRKHHVSRIVRGELVPWATYFCFVAWKEIEQSEAGDTLYHTFHFPEWIPCQTNWFTFRGNIDLELSPSVGPIFKHHHPGGLPQDVTLRPNAPGDLCTIPGQVGATCPNHYLNLDDIIPDEDATYIYNNKSVSSWFSDLYEMENINPSEVTKITSITLYARLKRIGGMPYAAGAYILLNTHGVTYQSGLLSPLGIDWEYAWWTITTNPFTGEAWTPQEINNLQIGVKLRAYWGVGWRTWSACTQLYAIIHRGIECIPY